MLADGLDNIIIESRQPLSELSRSTGISTTRLDKILTGFAIPTRDELRELLSKLNVPPGYNNLAYRGWELARHLAEYSSRSLVIRDTVEAMFVGTLVHARNEILESAESSPARDISDIRELTELLEEIGGDGESIRPWLIARDIADSIMTADSTVRRAHRFGRRNLVEVASLSRREHPFAYNFVIDYEGRTRNAVLDEPGTGPVTIYLNDSDPNRELAASRDVERAVRAWLKTQGAEIIYEGNPVVGSWWKALVARVKNPTEEDVNNGVKFAARTASLYGIDTRQAEVDKMQAEAFAAVMQALENVESAVIHSGTLLVVKHAGQVVRRELSQLDVENLRRHPILTTRPSSILQELQELAECESLPDPSRQREL
ncbi:helix-turn-helix transcriptional regulator [Nonomuraea sp. NPDC049784]|uniref:helix-turn-helix domain-containing protein n=1 Tax=Nonomuraea sp. NPDC049784 TaxID=3154361 RepID=UPI0033D43153